MTPSLHSPPCRVCAGSGWRQVTRRGGDDEGVEPCPQCGGHQHPLYHVLRPLALLRQDVRELRHEVDTLRRQNAKLAADQKVVTRAVSRGT